MTRAIRFLKERNIPHRVVEYEHLEKGAVFAAQAIGIPLKQTIKTLVVEIEPGGFCLVLMPGNRTLSFKKLAKIRHGKRAALVDTEMAEKLTGYLVGGISPFGVRKQMTVFMEASLLNYDEVAINGGKRGTMLMMRPLDIAATLEAETVDV